MSTSDREVRVYPEASDVAVLAMAVGDRGAYGTLEPGDFDLGACFPMLSPSGKAWFRLVSPDQVLRGALNCWWAAGAPGEERARRSRDAKTWYHANGAKLRERIIARQDAERARS